MSSHQILPGLEIPAQPTDVESIKRALREQRQEAGVA